MNPPSGRQIELRHGPWTAAVVEVGAAIRELSHEGTPLLDGYGEQEMASGGRGQPLIPWPNRVAGGAYEFGGRRIQGPISDPATGNASHGLVRWANWLPVEQGPAACAMELRLHPQPAYPFMLDLRLSYALAADGLTVELTAINAGAGPLPFGAGFHPYLRVGTDTVDEAQLLIRAGSWLPLDGRSIPTGERRPVTGSLDFGSGRPIAGAVLDHCFADLERDSSGRASVSLEGPAGRVTLWMDEAFGHLMVFTGDTLAPERRRRGLAVEPMTCAPDAFNSGDGLRVLSAGEGLTARWGITRTASSRPDALGEAATGV